MVHIVPIFYLWYCNILQHMIYRENPKSLTINYFINNFMYLTFIMGLSD